MLRTILSNIKRASLLVAMGSMALTACMDGDWDTPASIAENPPYGNNDIEKYADSRVTTVNALKQKYASRTLTIERPSFTKRQVAVTEICNHHQGQQVCADNRRPATAGGGVWQ